MVAQGGRGTLGNSSKHFKQTTRISEGTKCRVRLQFTQVFDAVLVGPANSGKSSILVAVSGGRVSSEAVQVSTRAYSTLKCTLGAVDVKTASSVVLMDTPAAKCGSQSAFWGSLQHSAGAQVVALVLARRDVDQAPHLVSWIKASESPCSTAALILVLNDFGDGACEQEAMLIRKAREAGAKSVYRISAADGTGLRRMIRGIKDNVN